MQTRFFFFSPTPVRMKAAAEGSTYSTKWLRKDVIPRNQNTHKTFNRLIGNGLFLEYCRLNAQYLVTSLQLKWRSTL